MYFIYSFYSAFISLLFCYFKIYIALFHWLTPFCLLPALSYFHCKLYFLPCYALFLLLNLTISPPSVFSKAFYLPLVSSHSFFTLFYYFFSAFIHCSLLGMDITVIAVPLQQYSYLSTIYFLLQISCVTLPLSCSIFPSICPGLFEFRNFFLFLAWITFFDLI